MQTSSRPRNVGGSFASRRGHANQLSISDPSHHITETIGTLYGESDDEYNDPRPSSFVASPYGGEQIGRPREDVPPPRDIPPRDTRRQLQRSVSDQPSDYDKPSSPTNGDSNKRSQTLPSRAPSQPSSPFDAAPMSPVAPASPTLRDMREDEATLGNIDNPGDIAQELSNLQALRRMSMDVSNTQDPDLLPFQGSIMAMPAIAPQGDDDETDPSRLLWVPAGVHPELAPTEFKNFLEKRVQAIKRRSSDSSLSADGLGRSDSNGGLQRKKSMLSRQVDNRGAEGYRDGSERLKRRVSSNRSVYSTPELSLEELMNDPTQALKKLTLESQQQEATGGESSVDDMPILPMAPGMGLTRSKHTTYRRPGSLKDRRGGSLRTGALPYSKRIAAQRVEEESSDQSASASPIDAPKGYGLTRVLSEPIPDNYRPAKTIRRQGTFNVDKASGSTDNSEQEYQSSNLARPTEQRHIPPAEQARVSSPVRQITETQPAEPEAPEPSPARAFPARSSSQGSPVTTVSQASHPPEEPPARSSRRTNYAPPSTASSSPQAKPQPPSTSVSQQQQEQKQQQGPRNEGATDQPVGDMGQHPSPMPGSGTTSTEALTFIPTFISEEKEQPKKKSRKEENDSESAPSRAKSWWKRGKNDDGKKSKTKATPEKTPDNARLDVLQTSIDTAKPKGRESLVIERESVDTKLEEERKKESNRKATEPKKENGFFANLLGVNKKKTDRDSGHKKTHSHQRQPSPAPPPYRPLRPDVDYYWTRFPILEERAIYRMAHIKLANPRRALQSQVLLSNFMYAYLAKVQAMHPQMQVPQSPQQRRLAEEERKRREQEQEEEYGDQLQAQDSIDQYGYDYHRVSL